MKQPDYLDYCTDDIEELYSKLQDNVLKTVAKRIIKYGEVTPSSWQQIKIVEESGLLYEDVISTLAEFTQLSQLAVQDMFSAAKVECIKYDNEICKAAGIPLLKENGSPAVNQIVKAAVTKTNGNLANLTMTTADAAQNKFIDACSVAEMEINTGAYDVNTAIRHAIEFAAQDGLDVYFYNDDEDGSVRTAKRNVVSAVRTAVLTGVSQTTGEISLEDAKAMGTDLMEMSAHIGARPSHSLWQGKIVCISQRQTQYLTLADIGYGEIDGFKGINCQHNWFPFLEGISTRAYTDKQLEEMNNATVMYNGNEIPLYKATQKQRAMERQIREERRQLVFYNESVEMAKSVGNNELAADVQIDFDNMAVKLKKHEAIYKDYCKQTGLPELSERLQYPSFNRSVSQKAVQANKSLQFIKNDAIIKKQSNLPKQVQLPDEKTKHTVDVSFAATKRAPAIESIVPKGATMTEVYVMAGKGTSVPIRELKRLYFDYRLPANGWQKKSGTIITDNFRYVVHWYECNGVVPIEEIKLKGVGKA